ncbi:MAG TPA: HEAT repeat domain-containing protein [Bryobacteraceae bacterium]|nr:HEAT repeat domain-containing protein [Bryobacteraceae bacterium]
MKRAFSLLITTAALLAQQPPVSNAKLETARAAEGLEQAVRAATAKQSGPAWIGYAIPRIPSDGNSCCWNNNNYGCGLEGQRTSTGTAPAGPVKLEGPTHENVLLRVEGGTIGKIRSFSMDCPLDAGGLPFHWLTDVNAAQSVAFLSGYVVAGQGVREKDRMTDGALHAIAQHAGADAAKALERFASSGANENIRKKSLFWLANSRGAEGYRVVERALREDPSEKVREHAIFCLTQSKEAGAIPAIVRAAKEDASVKVRGQALFWLAQRASAQAQKAISEAIQNDPNTEVKKKAVFALTQLPKDEGTPLLIQVARTNTNPAVRKQAMFWLGQSKDPRALKFFEEVLAR